MKNILFIYNIVFLFLGNTLLANIHFMHDHNHNHDYKYEIVECEECITFESSKDYDLDDVEIKSIKFDIGLFYNEFTNIVSRNILEISLSRAPPIS